MNTKSVIFGALGYLLCVVCPANAQQNVLTDEFNYSAWESGTAPMANLWTTISGHLPTLVTNDPALSASYLLLDNGVIGTNLNKTISSDFKLSINVLPTSYGSAQWVAILNAAGTQGYAFLWDSRLATQYGSQGSVCIQKYDIADPSSLNCMVFGKQLTTPVVSGHNPPNTTNAAISAPFALFELAWNAETHTLTLSVDGAVKASVVDASFSSFSRIFVSGNLNGRFDNLSVSTK